MKSRYDKIMEGYIVPLFQLLAILAFYGWLIYCAVKFSKSTDILKVAKIGFFLTWMINVLPSYTPPHKKFKLGNWKITIGKEPKVEGDNNVTAE